MAQDIKLKKNIVELDIDSITPYEGSHKTDANINLLIESIKDFGINQPITIDKNNVVVTGNGVYKAAKVAGLTKVPCIILDDLSDEEIKQYRIADDKTQEFATWNEKKLRKELSYLQDPSSMQLYFDQDILGMLGLNSKPKANPITPEEQRRVADTAKAMTRQQPTAEQRDREFKDQIQQIDLDMMVKPAEYIEYTCSKCGKLVKVKSN